MSMFYALSAIFLIREALTAKPAIGECPEVTTVPDFDIDRMLGRWYETKRYFGHNRTSIRCATTDYCLSDNDTIRVVSCQVSATSTGKRSTSIGIVSAPNPSEPAKLKVKFISENAEGDSWILGTDYESYAVVYSCTNLPLVNYKYAWLLTRECTPPRGVIEMAAAVAAKNHIDVSKFSRIDQSECWMNTWD